MNAAEGPAAAWLNEYEALTERAALVEPFERTQIEMSGPDRATFLHNLCTADIRKLEVGTGCEAYVTSVQGKTLGHVFVFAGPESLILDTVAGQGELLINHLDHYLISEQVELHDRSQPWSEMLLAGKGSAALAAELGRQEPPQAALSHGPWQVAGKSAWLRRVEITNGGGFLISTRREDGPAVAAAVLEAGAARAGHEAFEAARIERGFPLFDKDVSAKNLAQEVGRDEQAICFVKGCYLGQETVARIDALGHVQRMLVSLRFADSAVPKPGTELSVGETVVGQVTSSTYSPRDKAALALGYVRRGHNQPGTELTSPVGPAQVVVPGAL